MTRPWSRLAPVLTLAVGVTLGLFVGRSGSVVVVRAVAAPRAENGQAVAPANPSKPVGEAGIYDELNRQYERFHSVDQTFALVARAVSPSVVHIVAKKSGQPDDDGEPKIYEETGSGVIVRPDPSKGQYVLTNNHVVEGAQGKTISITLHDGRVIHPVQFWSDPETDIAVVDLGRDDLPTAHLGDSDDALVGHWVLALGSPFGLTFSVSQGIISARNRHEPELIDDGVENQEFLQTDAAINPGNSGGPLVNLKGEVIGINTAIASNGGGSEGVGFSIPINLAKWSMAQLVANGRVTRGAMGVFLGQLSTQSAQSLGLDRPRGATVTSVNPSSPAAKAGLQAGDVILRYNGIEVVDYNHLINLVSTTPIGLQADVVFWRGHKELMAKVAIGNREAVVVQTPEPPPRYGPLHRPARPDPPRAPSGGNRP